MNLGKIIYSSIAILSGALLFVYGGYDDSPGGQLLGALAILAGIVGLVKSRNRKAE